MKKLFLILLAATVATAMQAQVKTNYNNTEKIDAAGRFKAAYADAFYDINPPDLKNALARDRAEEAAGSKLLYIAEPIATNINFQKQASWASDGKMDYGRFTLRARGAQTLSINFSDFELPEGTEMYIYSKGGEMITGPITTAENNELKTWGSAIYKGDEVTVEVKLPAAVRDALSFRITNLAYGYKQLFAEKTAGFGLAGNCHTNVLCPAGNNWTEERNAVAFIATSTGAVLCSGAMVMNTANNNTPYVLTANHCFDFNNNVGGWRVFFQAWSPTCTPSQNNDGILFNGTTLRARWATSDFCLVQLNQTPACNSGIRYAGWTRSTTAATSGAGIHHPRGDVMKISTYTTALARENNPVRCNTTAPGTRHWVVLWNQGVTEPGSSGSPLFDQNRRIVGQLAGGPSACDQPANCRQDMYGRFDDSWAGGGTNASRLSNWLDPGNTGAQTTNTTNISNLASAAPPPTITGPASICNNATTYTLSGAPAGATVSWSVSAGTISGAGTSATYTPGGVRGNFTITATVTPGVGCPSFPVTRSISVNAPVSISSSIQGCSNGFQLWQLSASPTANGSNWSWTIGTLGTNSQINISSPSSPSTQVSVKGGGAVRLNYTDACGVARQDGVTVFSNCPAFRLSVSPNPANGNMVVSLAQATDDKADASEEAPINPLRKVASKGQTVLSLFELNTTMPVRQWKYNETAINRYNIDLTGLRKGTYLLQVDRDNQTKVIKVVVQ
jgi:lysyl endopeptidase